MVLLGTSGYSFRDWVGPFYPRGTRPGDMLAYYAQHFPVVELNVTYYRIPEPRVTERMTQVTPDDFLFMVKAPRSYTHDRDLMPHDRAAFESCLEPLRQAGKLAGVLCQFPYGFRRDARAEAHLGRVRDAVDGDVPVFVEFRHLSWNRDEVFAFLEDHELGYCSVDEPDLPGLMPPVARATGPEGYVRLHGRNRDTWWGRGEGDRYDYRYRVDELEEWADKVRAIDARTRRTFVFFNNCHEGQAVEGATLIAELLSIPLGGTQEMFPRRATS